MAVCHPARLKASCAGFTLVELVLVIVVIGLLTAATLKGVALLDSAKTKEVIVLAKDIRQASYAFKNRYHYLPGDLPTAAASMPGIAGACSYPAQLSPGTAGPGNGRIDTATEQSCAVDQLFFAGLLKAQPDPNQPGRYRLQTEYGNAWLASANTSGLAGIPATVQNVIVFATLPCSVATALDDAFDDGDVGNGRARGSVSSCANDPVPLFAVPL